MKTLLSKTIRALSLITLSLAVLPAGAATNYTSFSSLPASQVISNADGLSFYWKSNGVYFTRRTSWENLFSQVTKHSTNADQAFHATNADQAFHATNADQAIHASNADNVSNALTTNQVGVWLTHTNGSKSFYTNNFLACVNDETPSDLLEGSGVVSAPNPLTLTKTVHWKGATLGPWIAGASNSTGGLTVVGNVQIASGCSNSSFEGISFVTVNDNAAVFSSVGYNTNANNSFYHCLFADQNKTSLHVATFSGKGGLVDSCQFWNGLAHGMVILGGVGWTVQNCLSYGNELTSYVCKADVHQNGNCADIKFLHDVGDNGILIQAANTGTATSLSDILFDDVVIDFYRQLTVNSNALWAWIESDAGCFIKNLTVKNSLLNSINPTNTDRFCVIYNNGGAFSNLTFAANHLLTPTTNIASAFVAYPTALPDPNQINFEGNYLNNMLITGNGQSAFWSARGGIESPIVLTPETNCVTVANNGLIYFLFNTNIFSPQTEYYVKGDPIFATNTASAAYGVYAYVTNGIASYSVPLPGYHGYAYVACTFSGTNGLYAPSAFSHGKVFAQIYYQIPYQASGVVLTKASGANYALHQNQFVESKIMPATTSWMVPTNGVELNTYSICNDANDFPILIHHWATASGVYFGVFAAPQQAFVVNNWPVMDHLTFDISMPFPIQSPVSLRTTRTWQP